MLSVLAGRVALAIRWSREQIAQGDILWTSGRGMFRTGRRYGPQGHLPRGTFEAQTASVYALQWRACGEEGCCSKWFRGPSGSEPLFFFSFLSPFSIHNPYFSKRKMVPRKPKQTKALMRICLTEFFKGVLGHALDIGGPELPKSLQALFISNIGGLGWGRGF